MKAIAKVQDLSKDLCKNVISRNLSRIMDIRILEIDNENKTITLLYDSGMALEKAKRELWRIGYPILQCISSVPDKISNALDAENSLAI
jgi:hypothetical protein